MDFFEGLTDELVKLAGEEGDTMYGHGDGKEKSGRGNIARGAVGGAAAGGAALHGVCEDARRAKITPFDLYEAAHKGGATAEAAKDLLATGGKAKAWHRVTARQLPLALLGGAGLGAAAQGVRRIGQKLRGEKKEAGILGHAKPGLLGRMAAKAPKKAIGAAALGGAAYGAGHHRGLKKGEGEAVQVGEQAYGAGARDMENALMSELGIG